MKRLKKFIDKLDSTRIPVVSNLVDRVEEVLIRACAGIHTIADDKPIGDRFYNRRWTWGPLLHWDVGSAVVGVSLYMLQFEGKAVTPPKPVTDAYYIQFRPLWWRLCVDHFWYDGPHCMYCVGPFWFCIEGRSFCKKCYGNDHD